MKVIVSCGMISVDCQGSRYMMHPADAAEWAGLLRWRVWSAIEQARATVALDLPGSSIVHLFRSDALTLARRVTEAVDALTEERLESECFQECQYEIA